MHGEPLFWKYGGILLWTDFWFKILLKFKASMPLFANFIFRNGRFFVSVLSHTLTALNSLFEEMSKIILWSRCSGDAASAKCKVKVDSYKPLRSSWLLALAFYREDLGFSRGFDGRYGFEKYFKRFCALHTSANENRFALSTNTDLATKFQTGFNSTLLCFSENSSKLCCINVTFSKMCRTFKRHLST